MPIPFEVYYTTTKRVKERNVLGVIPPTIFNQLLSTFKVEPIIVEMGDIEANWEETSPGFELLNEATKPQPQ